MNTHTDNKDKASPSIGLLQRPLPSLGPSTSPVVAMSSRGNQRRGPNRNSEISQHGEELAAWKEIKDQLPGLIDMFNQSSSNTAAIYEQDKLCAEKKKNNSKCTYVVLSCCTNRANNNNQL